MGPAGSPSRRSSAGGFTLVEVLIASAIAALLATAMAYLFSGILNTSRSSKSTDDLSRDAQLAVSLMRRDIESATSIVGASGNKLSMWAPDGSKITYGMAGTTPDSLLRQIDAGTKELVAANVKSLQFSLNTISRTYTAEELAPDTTITILRSFEPGDWDGLIAVTHCDYRSAGEEKVADHDIAGIEFWNAPAGFLGIPAVEVRVRAKDHYPCEEDMIVKVFKAQAYGARYPDLLLAQGVIDRFEIDTGYDWHRADLIQVVDAEIDPLERYWVVVESAARGGGTYAGHVQYERIEHCDSGEWPVNDSSFRESNNDGGSWSSSSYDEEAFYRIWGWTAVMKVKEVTHVVTDTLGISYELILKRGEDIEHSAGFIAFQSL